ncbi:MAG: Gldg family protein [Pseudomonadota bacterium]|nr:Gldg family protein [Pseudomonadota bacterium]
MSTRTQQRLSTSSLALLAVAFIVAVSVTNQVFKGWRIDLTENNLYTLSDGTRSLLANLEGTVNLYFYFSDQASQAMPSLRNYANRVREMLEEFEAEADGNIRLNVIDPLPFSEDEDRAAQFGLQGVRLGTSPDAVYMGLAGTDSIDNEEIIPFFQPDKETFLEYDIAKLVSTLSSPKRPVIGLISDVQMAGSFDPQTQRMSQPWVVYQQAQQLFEVRNLGTSLVQIADDISLLWIVQPKDLSNDTLYAIDQFVMNGGNAIIFVDPVADVDPVAMEGMPQGMPPMGQGSDLPELFDAWGITFSTEEVVADAELALQISGMDRRPVRHYGYIGVTGKHMSADNIVTADLSVVHVATGGTVGGVENGPLTVEPLLSSSSNAQTMPATRFSFVPDPAALQDGFVPQGDPFTLAARFNGSLSSAFPDGPPPTNISLEDGDDTAVRNYADHRTHSSDPVNLIVVGDVDMLADHLWVQVQNLFGQQLTNAFASNGAFVVNALENLSGSSDLIGVRSRASFTRPFTKVESLRVDAEARFRTTEERLQRELDETERRLVELQSAREDSGNILLTPAQQGEIDRFVDQRGVIRQELRAVQRGLDEDIERLGTIVKVINIGLVPTLLTGFVLIAVWRRNRRLP